MAKLAEERPSGSSNCARIALGLALTAILVLQVISILITSGVLGPTISSGSSGSEHLEDKRPLNDGLGPQPDKVENKVNITKSFYGTTPSGEDVDKFTFVNENGVRLEVITLGGTITKLTAPCRHGHLRDVIAGFDNLQDYVSKNTDYMGPMIGRFANRIARGQFEMDGVTFNLTKNDGRNHLHGGGEGWDKRVWRAEIKDNKLVLRYSSPDGESGYPGEVHVKVYFELTEKNEVIITFDAHMSIHVKKPSPINLTAHPYFNLGGQGNRTIYDHNVTIYADKYLEVDDELIPSGTILDVEGSPLDFRSPVVMGDRINDTLVGGVVGVDNCFVLGGPTGKRKAATVYHPHSGRIMTVYTNQPALQFYTGNFLNVPCGKDCVHYGKHSAFCLEPQNYPDAVNQASFPDSILHRYSSYINTIWYQFTTDADEGH